MLNNKLGSRKHLLLGSTICFVGALFYCYEFILRIIPGALQSELSSALGHISATKFGQVSALYYFAYSPMQMPVGMLMDRYGPKRLLTFACICCTIGSWMFTLTYSIFLVGAGRFLVGFGSSFAFVGVLSLTVHWLPRRYFSLVAGLITTLGMLGLMYGEIKITQWSELISWIDVLQGITVIGGILSVVIFFVVRDGPQEGGAPHQYALPEFFKNVLKVLMAPSVWVIGLIGACLYTSLSVFGELWGKTYLEQAHHLTSMEAAKTISAVFLGWAVGAPLSGYISDRSGKPLLLLVFGAGLSLVCISLVLYVPNLSYVSLNLLLFLYGLFSATEIIVFIMAKECTGADLSGTVFAATNMIIMFAGVLFQPLVGILLDYFNNSSIVAGEHLYTRFDYQMALSLLPVSLIFVLFLAFLLKNNPGLKNRN